MRFISYLVLFYLFLPVNRHVDMIAIIIFFIFWHEPNWVGLFYALLVGLLADLYYPSMLGLNTLVLMVLGQAIVYLRGLIVQNPPITSALFGAFFLSRVVIINVISAADFRIWPIVLTMLAFVPVYYGLKKITRRQWMKA